MPVSTESSIAGPYYPNGSTVDFSFAFKASSAGEVVAWDGDGNLISPALYSVTLDEDEGGMLTFGTAPESADYPVIYVVSDPEMTQTANFDNAGPSFNPAALTRAIDRAAIRDLKQQREIDRGLKVPFGEDPGTLPSSDERAGKFLAYDAYGYPVAASGTGTDAGLRTDLAQGNGHDLVGGLGDMAVQDAANVAISGGKVSAELETTSFRRPGFYNFKASSFLRWSAALAAHRAGVSRAYIACIGDSTTRGVGSNPSSATADLIRRSWPSVLADALNQMPNTKATANSLWCDGFFTLVGGGNLAIADPRVSWETGWQTHPTMFVAGGKSLQYPNSASGTGRFNVDFTVGASGTPEDDTCDVHYVKFPGFGDLLLTTNDAAEFVASAATSGASGVGKLTGTRSAYEDTAWTIQRAAGTPGVNLIFYGIESYKAADKPIGVWNMGASGSLAANWVDDNQPYSFVNVIQSLAPHLCIICLTINDWAADTAEATYKANMQDIIDACAVNSDILLVVGVPSNTGTAPVLRQQAFAGYVRDLAATNDLPVLDLSERWVSQALLPSRGLYYDGLHPSNVGYADVGNLTAQVVGNPGMYFG